MTERENVLMSGYREHKEWEKRNELGGEKEEKGLPLLLDAVVKLFFLLVLTNAFALFAAFIYWASPVLFFPLYLFGLI